MKFEIIETTDRQYIGMEITDEFPIVLGSFSFLPDMPAVNLGDGNWRFYNSNFSIIAKET